MSQLFIVHGWTYSLDKWSEVCGLLEARGIEPVLLKVPGLTEPSDQVWDIDGYIDWLNTKLKDHANPILVGHSNGGRIAMAYAQKYPGKLKQLILMDSAGVVHDDLATKLRLATLRTISRLAKLISWVPGVRSFGYKLIGARDYRDAPPNMRLTMQNMLRANAGIHPEALKLPVTIIWGSDDSVTPLSDADQLHQSIAGSVLKVVDGARHAPQTTHAAVVADLLAEAVGS